MIAPLEVLSLADLWAFSAAQNRMLARSSYLAVLEDARLARLFGVRSADGSFVAIGAVTPVLPGLLVAWFSVLPGGLGGKLLPVRAIRHLLDRVATVGTVVAVVSETDERAQRIARLIGFRWVEAGRYGTGVWQWPTR